MTATPESPGRLPQGQKLPGILDVARAAGVSHQTVSRVLNQHPNVRVETRESVLRTIADLGYRRNAAARTLVTRKSGVIGILTPRSVLFGPTSTLISVEAAAREAGFFVSLASLSETTPAAMSKALEHFVGQGVEGLVVIAPGADLLEVAGAVSQQVPMVMISAGAEPHGEFRVATVDNEYGAREAMRHLVDLGHRRIAHLAGPDGSLEAAARTRGWQAELAVTGARSGGFRVGDWTADSGYAFGRELLADGLPTAVFAGNDLMALGVIQAFREGGISVPQQVSVVGFDDVDGARFFDPPLTTLRQDFSTLGRRCIRMLTGLLAGEEVVDALVKPDLVRRSSTAPVTLR